MNIKAHCNICDHRIYDFQTGAICGLTYKSPDFGNKCNVIKPEKQLEAKIVEVYTKLKLVTKTKNDTLSHFIFYCLIIIGVLVFAYFLSSSETYIRSYYISPFLIFLVICLIAVAVGPANKYIRDYKIAKKQQEELDELLKIYKLDYKVSIKILNEAHGGFDVEKKVKIFRVG